MQPEEMADQMLGHYRIIRPLGYGGTATVFLAQDIHLQRDVAIKVFLPKEGDTQDFLRRFAREARVLAQLDHPNILPVYEYGEEGTRAFLVMPHMAGGSLRDWLRKRGPVSPNETVQLINQILGALQYAHERNLIHRDIKPGNMLFKADGTLMLSDFGLVKVLTGNDGSLSLLNDSGSITAQELNGTPDYMAPEQIQGKVVLASDIYALGVVLYEMLTGSHLFNSDNYIGVLVKHMYEQPRPLREINPRISIDLEYVVMQALHKDPTLRYQRPNDLRQALLQALRGSITSTPDTIETTAIIPSIPSISSNIPTSIISTPSIQNEHTHINQQVPAIHLYIPQSTPITPVSATHSDAHPAIRLPPGPTSYPTPSPPVYQTSLPTQRHQRSGRPLIVSFILLALILIAGLGGILYTKKYIAPPQKIAPPSVPAPGITPINKGATTPIAGNTQPVPLTQTNCPAAGQARAAITAPLALGNHQNVVYIVNEGTPANPTYGTIKRHEANFNQVSGVEISKMAQTYISEAQVSRDGQWVLFVARTVGQNQLRMVRVDGQGLQTLYCASINETISSSQWSFDQKTIIFNISQGVSIPNTYLLDVTTGNIQEELIPQSIQAYTPRTWLDNTHIYMTGSVPNSDRGVQDLYILDIKKGANQHDNNLQKIVPGLQPCGSFDSSYDSSQLIVSTCQLVPVAGSSTVASNGPTTISSESAIGGITKPIQTLEHAVTMLRSVRPTILLLLVENSISDTSQNGLWQMNSDGTGLTRLLADTSGGLSLCQFSQYAWSNISLDSTLYAAQEIIPNADPTKSTYKMYYGYMGGGTPYTFANITGTQLLLAGWTSL